MNVLLEQTTALETTSQPAQTQTEALLALAIEDSQETESIVQVTSINSCGK